MAFEVDLSSPVFIAIVLGGALALWLGLHKTYVFFGSVNNKDYFWLKLSIFFLDCFLNRWWSKMASLHFSPNFWSWFPRSSATPQSIHVVFSNELVIYFNFSPSNDWKYSACVFAEQKSNFGGITRRACGFYFRHSACRNRIFLTKMMEPLTNFWIVSTLPSDFWFSIFFLTLGRTRVRREARRSAVLLIHKLIGGDLRRSLARSVCDRRIRVFFCHILHPIYTFLATHGLVWSVWAILLLLTLLVTVHWVLFQLSAQHQPDQHEHSHASGCTSYTC